MPQGRDFPYPPASQNVAYEFELVAAIGKGGADISVHEALNQIFGYAVGLDMTRRDLQLQAQKMARPWLELNGKRVQNCDLSALIWKVPEIIAQASTLFRLTPGDLVFTATPAGVGPVRRGDLLPGAIEGVGELTVRVV